MKYAGSGWTDQQNGEVTLAVTLAASLPVTPGSPRVAWSFLGGQPGAALGGEAVFLEAAAGFFRDGHFEKSFGNQGAENLVPELGAITSARLLHHA